MRPSLATERSRSTLFPPRPDSATRWPRTRPSSQQYVQVRCKFLTFDHQDSTNSPASVWDLLAHPELGDVRDRPYTERRAHKAGLPTGRRSPRTAVLRVR